MADTDPEMDYADDAGPQIAQITQILWASRDWRAL